MKILKTNEEYESELLKIISEKPKILYIASYGIKISDFTKELISKKKKTDLRILVGYTNMSNKQQAFIKKQLINVKFKKNCHLKLIVSDRCCIIGGRNLTDSGYNDLSFRIKPNLELKNYFLKLYK